MLPIIYTCIILYFYLIILLRFFGKKEFSQLNVFDFVVFLILAELMALSVGSEDFPIYYSILATALLVGIDRIIGYLTLHYKGLRDLLDGKPTYIIYDGKLMQQTMKKLRYTIDDLTHQLRVGGVDNVETVAFALLETNGQLSIILKENRTCEIPEAVIEDGIIDERTLSYIGITKQELMNEIHSLGYELEDIFYCTKTIEHYYIIKKDS